MGLIVLILFGLLGCIDSEEPLGPPTDSGMDLQLLDSAADTIDRPDSQMPTDAIVDTSSDLSIDESVDLSVDQSLDADEMADTVDARVCIDLSGTYVSNYMRCSGAEPASFTLVENEPCVFSSNEDDQLRISTEGTLSANRGGEDCTISFDDSSGRLSFVCGFGPTSCQITAVPQ